MDNPCVTLPISENWVVDYTNLRCQRNYQVDSGWQLSYKNKSLWGLKLYWNGSIINSNASPNKSYTFGNSTYFTGATQAEGVYCEGFCFALYPVRLVQNLTEYKAFSSF